MRARTLMSAALAAATTAPVLADGHDLCCRGRPAGFASREDQLLGRPIADQQINFPGVVTRDTPAAGAGRVFVDNTIIGGRPFPPRRRWPDRSPADFGAPPAEADARVLAIEGNLVVPISPWTRFETGAGSFETARQAWLRERGYAGGVRTFRNPRVVRVESVDPPERLPRTVPEPSGWFRRPPEMPRTKPIEHVRISLPPTAPKAVARRVEMSNAVFPIVGR